MKDYKSIDTPVDKAENLSLETCPKTQNENDSMKRVPYSNAIGNLMYAMLWTHFDICYAEDLVSRYQPIRDKHIGKLLREC